MRPARKSGGVLGHPSQAAAIRALSIEGVRPREIAQLVECAVQTVHSRIFEARQDPAFLEQVAFSRLTKERQAQRNRDVRALILAGTKNKDVMAQLDISSSAVQVIKKQMLAEGLAVPHVHGGLPVPSPCGRYTSIQTACETLAAQGLNAAMIASETGYPLLRVQRAYYRLTHVQRGGVNKQVPVPTAILRALGGPVSAMRLLKILAGEPVLVKNLLEDA